VPVLELVLSALVPVQVWLFYSVLEAAPMHCYSVAHSMHCVEVGRAC